jgi:imidazolonepropionase-like amidohydrolase
MNRRRFALTTASAAWAVATLGLPAHAQTAGSRAAAPPAQILITNARVFDGRGDRLSEGMNVLVEGNKIAKISSSAIAAAAGATVIDAKGRTLMPGLIDAHWHSMMAAAPLSLALGGDTGYLNLLAAQEARNTLMRGFTSVRDLAGPAFGLKRAIDEGVTPGPRIWAAGAMISQTSGHADYRSPQDLPRTAQSPLSQAEASGGSAIADGPDQVRLRAREQLMLGAVFLKLAAGGGVASNFDPLDVSQYIEAEIRAAVEAAENWGTYVTVHAYTPRAMRTAILAGVKCIDHGHLMDEATAQLMAEKGVWLSLQPFLDDADSIPFPAGSPSRIKQLLVTEGTDRSYALAKKYKLKTAWGTDTLFDAKLAQRQGAQLAKMVRWYTPAEVLRLATSNNAELLALSGPRSPYEGRLGVVAEGALADLLLVDGDPIANIKLIEDPAKNFVLIMKDGKVHKNMLN